MNVDIGTFDILTNVDWTSVLTTVYTAYSEAGLDATALGITDDSIILVCQLSLDYMIYNQFHAYLPEVEIDIDSEYAVRYQFITMLSEILLASDSTLDPATLVDVNAIDIDNVCNMMMYNIVWTDDEFDHDLTNKESLFAETMIALGLTDYVQTVRYDLVWYDEIAHIAKQLYAVTQASENDLKKLVKNADREGIMKGILMDFYDISEEEASIWIDPLDTKEVLDEALAMMTIDGQSGTFTIDMDTVTPLVTGAYD